MLLNLHHRNSKLDNFKDEKTSDHKTVSVAQRNNCPAYQIMTTFGGHFFMFFEQHFFNNFKKYCSVCTKKLHKMK